MSLEEDAKKAASAIATRHWRIWEWLNGKLTRTLSMRPTHRPESLGDLWSTLAKNGYEDGDFIDIRPSANGEIYWYVQEWLPRAPGALWLQDSLFELPVDDLAAALDLRTARGRLADLFYAQHSHWEGRFGSTEATGRSLARQGFAYRSGIYRPALANDDDRYAVLGLVTNKEYLIDLAFPIVVSRQVYRKVMESRTEANAVEFEGRFQIRSARLSDMFQSYLSAVGADRDDSIKPLIENVIGISNAIGYVASPLDISTRSHSSHPIGTLRVEGHNGHPLTARNGVILLCRNIVDDPSDLPAQLDEHSFLLGQDVQFSTILHPITDFDARHARFRCDAPVSINPKNDPTVIKSINDAIAG